MAREREDIVIGVEREVEGEEEEGKGVGSAHVAALRMNGGEGRREVRSEVRGEVRGGRRGEGRGEYMEGKERGKGWKKRGQEWV